MAIEFLAAMQTPVLLVEIGPIASATVRAEQVQLFVVGK
jgi:hypothetical protein